MIKKVINDIQYKLARHFTFVEWIVLLGVGTWILSRAI